MIGKELVDYLLTVVEAGQLKTAEGLGEVEEISARGDAQNCKSSRHQEPLASGGSDAVAVIHKEQIGVNLRRQCNSRFSPASRSANEGSLDRTTDRISSQAGGWAIQFRTNCGVFGRVSSSLTTDGRIILSNRTGRTWMWPIRIR